MTSHTTTVHFDATDEDIEVDLEVGLGAAEPDVGIMGAYIEGWRVIAVNGNSDKHLCADMEQRIVDDLGDETFCDQLYDEGVADDDGYEPDHDCPDYD
jgi:hypothetical protein